MTNAEENATILELTAALAAAERAKQRLLQEIRYLRQETFASGHHGEIVGSSPALQAARCKMSLVAGTDTTVLVQGESGTGKELIAWALHANSHRRDQPLVKLDCGTDATEFAERVELADGGTLFLNEVSDLPLDRQADLMHVTADVRIVATTHRNLQSDVASGRFRSDLYSRLNVFPIELPPLRDRPEDIEPLARHVMARVSRKLGKSLREIEPATLSKLRAHRWPGNVRELEITIERAAALANGDTLAIHWDLGNRATMTPVTSESASGEVLTLEALERAHIITVLQRTRGVIEGPKGAARLLNLKPSTARFRMKKLGIARGDFSHS
jgi:transcriptional regulator with GAF, ATPase, and Fis domain